MPVRKTFPLEKENLNFPVRNTEALADFLSDARKGEIGGPFGSLGGYYIFALDSLIPATLPAFEQAQSRVESVLERMRYEAAMRNYLDALHEQLLSGTRMETIAQQDTIVNFEQSVTGQTIYILRNAYGDEFAGAVAALEPGQISNPVITRYTGYIIRVDGKYEVPFDSTMLGMLQWKRQLMLQQVSQSIFTPEEIVDNRDKFFE